MKTSLFFKQILFFASSAFLIGASKPVFAQQNQNELLNSFSQRLILRESGTLNSAHQLKEKLRLQRYQEDILMESQVNELIPVDQKSSEAFLQGVGLQINPRMSELRFRTGDVILLRGQSTISTTIAVLTESPSQFSHALMVYENPENHQLMAVESLLDQGTIVHPLSDVLKEGTPHAVLYRHKDPVTSQLAGKKAFELAQSYLQAGKTYPYDFQLDMNDYSAIYCAELVREAFDLVTGGRDMVPSFPSLLGPKFSKTVKSLNVSFDNKIVFNPSDMDTEARFDLVAEWRDPKATLNFRIKDQILLKLFQWIEDGSVQVDYSSVVGTVKNQGSSDKGEIDASQFQVLATRANEIVNRVTVEILKANAKQKIKTGRNLTAEEIQMILEKWKGSLFMKMLLMQKGFQFK